MLAEALQAEVDAYIAAHAAERDENGRRLVVRNGSHQPREVLTSAGAVQVTAPRVNDKRTDPGTGERQRFSSQSSMPCTRGVTNSRPPMADSWNGTRWRDARQLQPGGGQAPSPLMWRRLSPT